MNQADALPSFIRSTLILSSHLRLGLLGESFGFPNQNVVCIYLIPERLLQMLKIPHTQLSVQKFEFVVLTDISIQLFLYSVHNAC